MQVNKLRTFQNLLIFIFSPELFFITHKFIDSGFASILYTFFFFYSNSHPSLIHLPSSGLSFPFCASWLVPGVKCPPANAGDSGDTGLIPG